MTLNNSVKAQKEQTVTVTDARVRTDISTQFSTTFQGRKHRIPRFSMSRIMQYLQFRRNTVNNSL